MRNRPHVKDSSRLSSDERRQAIVDAVRGVFATKGFDRTTSRDLAKAARVSQALLYKYFPTKLSLYEAMLRACAETQSWSEADRIQAAKPSTARLIVMVDSFIRQVVERRSTYFDDAVGRLAVRSLLENGDFARTILKPFTDSWVASFEKCLKRAAVLGDLQELPTTPQLGAWLIHHIALGLMLHGCPNTPIDYRVPKQVVIQQSVRFALRGIGLKEESIKRHFDSRAISAVE